MLRFYTLLFLCLFLHQSPVLGQYPGISYETMDGNQVRARVNNSGDMFWDLETNARYEVPAGTGNHSAFAAGIWLGALDQGDGLHVAANTYRQVGNDFFPGPIRNSTMDGEPWFIPDSPTILQTLGLADGRVAFISATQIEILENDRVTSQIIPFPGIRSFGRALQLDDGQIMIYGDRSYPNQEPLYLLDTASFNLTISASLSSWQGRSSAIQLSNGQVAIFGVFGTEIFDPATGTASAGALMGTPRVRTSLLELANGNVLVVGGSTTLNGFGGSTLTEVYDPVADSWTAGPSMALNRVRPTIAPIPNGNYIIAGGNLQSGLLEELDPNGLTISPSYNLPQSFENAIVAPRADGSLAFVVEDQSDDNIDFFVLDPQTGDVEEAFISTVLPQGTVLPNGNIFVVNRNAEYAEFDIANLRPLGSRWQEVWKVGQSEIDEFLQDFNNNTVDFSKYPDIETWPGNGDLSKGEDQYLAPFIDVDLDGVYDPLNDGDYPCIEGNQSLYWVFNDVDGPHTESGGDPLGVQVEAMAFAFDCQNTPCNYSATDFSTFYRYEITNKSENNYKDFYFGMWMDVDLGGFADDFVGSDTSRGLAFVYNGDNSDLSYGNTPPAFGTMLLSTPDGRDRMTNFHYYDNDFSIRGNPENTEHFYNYLRSVWKDGTPVTEGGNGYGGSTPTNYFFPGDAGFCGGPATGWSEVSENNTPFDRRYIQSFGPIDLPKDSTIRFDVMMVFNQGFTNPPLGSVCELFTAADSVSSWYRNNLTECYSVPTSVSQGGKMYQSLMVAPNPSQDQVRFSVDLPVVQDAQITILDQLGRAVKHEVLLAGQAALEMNTSGLPDGVYIVRLQEGNTVYAQRMIIQH